MHTVYIFLPMPVCKVTHAWILFKAHLCGQLSKSPKTAKWRGDCAYAPTSKRQLASKRKWEQNEEKVWSIEKWSMSQPITRLSFTLLIHSPHLLYSWGMTGEAAESMAGKLLSNRVAFVAGGLQLALQRLPSHFGTLESQQSCLLFLIFIFKLHGAAVM